MHKSNSTEKTFSHNSGKNTTIRKLRHGRFCKNLFPKIATHFKYKQSIGGCRHTALAFHSRLRTFVMFINIRRTCANGERKDSFISKQRKRSTERKRRYITRRSVKVDCSID